MKNPFRVWKDVYQVGGSEISGPGDCSIYLIEVDEESILIDSGVGRSFDKLVRNIENLDLDPRKLKTLIATHNHIDHIGSLAKFKEKFGVEVIAHELDARGIESGRGIGAELYGAEYTPCKVDLKLSKKEEGLKFGKYELRFLHVPGHTPGSIVCYLGIKDKRILFGQDIHGPYNLPGADPIKAKKSLRKLIDLRADILCEGHFGIYRPKGEVEEYIRGYLEGL